MELKSLEDWTLEKQFKSVPGVVDVSSFGGITREYQVRVDPDKLVSYGLSIGQVEQQSPTTIIMPAAASSRRASSRSTFARWAYIVTFTTSRRRSSRRSREPRFV